MSSMTIPEPNNKGKVKKVVAATLATTLALAIGVPATFAAVVGDNTGNTGSADAPDQPEVGAVSGARLHDDFAGFGEGHNKNVYFENFVADGEFVEAQPVFVSVKLTHQLTTKQYSNSTAVNDIPANTVVAPVVDDFGVSHYADGKVDIIFGADGDRSDDVYMPTFNKATTGDNVTKNDVRSVNTNNYKIFAPGETESAKEIGYDGTEATAATEHTAAAIPNTKVYPDAASWEAAGKRENVWVYDATSQSYYWSSKLMPGEVTGMLIDDAVVNYTGGWDYTLNVQGTWADIDEPQIGTDGKYYFGENGTVEISQGIYSMLHEASVVLDEATRTAIANATLGDDSVTIDGYEFRVMSRDDQTGEASLAFDGIIDASQVASNSAYWTKSNSLSQYINGSWLEDKPSVEEAAVARDYKTAYPSDTVYATVNQKITIPSCGDFDTSYVDATFPVGSPLEWSTHAKHAYRGIAFSHCNNPSYGTAFGLRSTYSDRKNISAQWVEAANLNEEYITDGMATLGYGSRNTWCIVPIFVVEY